MLLQTTLYSRLCLLHLKSGRMRDVNISVAKGPVKLTADKMKTRDINITKQQ